MNTQIPQPSQDTHLTSQDLDFLNSIFDLVRDNKPLALTSLLNQGLPVNLTNSNGDTLLILAAYHEHEDMVRILIDAGADLNRLNDRGQTALVCAVFRDNEPIAHLGTQTPAQVAQFFDLPSMQKLLAN